MKHSVLQKWLRPVSCVFFSFCHRILCSPFIEDRKVAELGIDSVVKRVVVAVVILSNLPPVVSRLSAAVGPRGQGVSLPEC